MYKICLGLVAVSMTMTAYGGGGHAHWSYSGHTGPQAWADIDAAYYACRGKNQSPVDVSAVTEASLDAIAFDYSSGGQSIVNNGHTVQINDGSNSGIIVDGKRFRLLQYHFHAPSEHHIGSQSYPMEGHFVHADADGNLAVIGVMFNIGSANEALSQLWRQLPMHAGEEHVLAANVNPAALLPSSRSYYRYNGSLTTPPCSEGVRWLVMRNAISASQAQIDAFKHALHEPNNRPIQPANARLVLQ